MEWKQLTQFITMHNLGSKGPIRLERQREEKYSGSNTLLQLLRDHKEADCQDRKDKVYGLVGMASDARGFFIDYEKSLFEIWTDVMEFMNQHHLFHSEDVISVGHLVKFLLMGAECDPLQQILRSYAPRDGDDTIIIDTSHPKAFEIQGAVLGCVIYVGPQPNEMIGKLDVVDGWIQQVQANYRKDLGSAHRESDEVIHTILDLDDNSLSRKCYDCRSIIQWWEGWNGFLGGPGDSVTDWLQRLQIEAKDISQMDSSPAAQPSADTSRLFQMSTQHRAPWKLGLSSSDIRVGDIICWLGWPRRAVVVRAYHEWHRWKLQVVGTAVVAADLRKAQLGSSQRLDWFKDKPDLSIFLDARTIFVLLAD
jgi:hypothetical protein